MRRERGETKKCLGDRGRNALVSKRGVRVVMVRDADSPTNRQTEEKKDKGLYIWVKE